MLVVGSELISTMLALTDTADKANEEDTYVRTKDICHTRASAVGEMDSRYT